MPTALFFDILTNCGVMKENRLHHTLHTLPMYCVYQFGSVYENMCIYTSKVGTFQVENPKNIHGQILCQRSNVSHSF